MIREITSLGIGNQPKALSARFVAYSISLVAATTAAGASAGALGSVIGRRLELWIPNGRVHIWWMAALAVMAIAYSLRELAIIRLPMPQVHWQVPDIWSDFGKTTQAILYGLVLGLDVLTLIPYATFYVLLMLEASLGTTGGAVVGLTYGITRVISTFTVYVRVEGKSAELINFAADRVLSLNVLFHRANGLVLLLVGEAMVAALLIVR